MAAPIQTDRGPNNPSSTDESGTPDQKLIALAVKRWNRANENEAFMRQQAMEDDKFRDGDQWPAQIKSDRTIQKRPCLTINKMGTFCHQVVNQHKMNRPAGNVLPVGDKSDVETARMIKGWFRQIERTGGAEDAYDAGFDSAVTGGWGWWRVLADYESPESFNQVLKFERIQNRFSVYPDPLAKLPTAADAEWMFVSEFMSREDFEEQYPDADPCEWTEYGTGDEIKDWSNQTHLRVSEYFYFETKKRVRVALATGHIGFEDELAEEVKAQIAAEPALLKNKRTVEVKTLQWCKLTAKEVLERAELPIKHIPVIRVIGDETVVSGKPNYAGVVRHAKDPQRMYNYWCTAETELIALQPKAPWVMEEGQVEGHERRWQRANIDSQPYLLYKGSSVAGKPAPPPQRQPFQGSPDGVVKAKIGAAQDMQATTGIRFDATLQERMHDESGAALVELKRIGEMGQYHFTDNFAKSLSHTWEILLDWAPKIYDVKRVMTILREDDTEEQVALDPNMQQGTGEERTAEGAVRRLFNPNIGTYAVAVTTGPNYMTKRQESATQMIEFLRFLPQTAPLISDLVAKNMDWPDAEVIAERLASQLPPHLLMKQLKNLPPQARAAVGALQAQLQKLGEEHKQALNLLGEKQTEQAQEQQKIDDARKADMETFDAKMADIFVKWQTAQAKEQGEQEQRQADILTKVADLAMAVEQFKEDRALAADEQSLRRDEMAFEQDEARLDREAKDKERNDELVKQLSELVKSKPKPKIKAIHRPRNGVAKVEYDDNTSRDVRVH